MTLQRRSVLGKPLSLKPAGNVVKRTGAGGRLAPGPRSARLHPATAPTHWPRRLPSRRPIPLLCYSLGNSAASQLCDCSPRCAEVPLSPSSSRKGSPASGPRTVVSVVHVVELCDLLHGTMQQPRTPH